MSQKAILLSISAITALGLVAISQAQPGGEGRGPGGEGRGPGFGRQGGPPGGPPSPQQLFAEIDADGDGMISEDEFMKHHEERFGRGRPQAGPPMGRGQAGGLGEGGRERGPRGRGRGGPGGQQGRGGFGFQGPPGPPPQGGGFGGPGGFGPPPGGPQGGWNQFAQQGPPMGPPMGPPPPGMNGRGGPGGQGPPGSQGDDDCRCDEGDGERSGRRRGADRRRPGPPPRGRGPRPDGPPAEGPPRAESSGGRPELEPADTDTPTPAETPESADLAI